MSGINNFKVFDENMTNMFSDAQYETAPQRKNGVMPGIAISQLHNKLYRQTSIMAAAIGELIAGQGLTASDADLLALTQTLSDALKKVSGAKVLFWQPNTDYQVGQVIYSDNIIQSGQKYECVQSGKSGSAEPVWPIVGQQIADGTVIWEVTPVSFKFHLENMNNPHGVTTEQIGAVNKNNLYFDSGGRSIIRYKDANSVYVSGMAFTMSGFRFEGQYLKGRGRYAELATPKASASLITDLGCQTEKDVLNWYAVFACCNDNDANAVLKIMPYFRVSSTAGNVITLGNGGENSDPSIVKTYSMNDNVLADADILVINEKLNLKSNTFSGRVSKITANTNNTITLDNVGTLEQGDYLLPAPPGYSDYRYLGSFYIDSTELRNISDDGINVVTRGVNVQGININADITAGVVIPVRGYVCPLATGVRMYISQTLNITGTGSINMQITMEDLLHTIFSMGGTKALTAAETWTTEIMLPFEFTQAFGLKTTSAGQSTNASLTRQVNVRGWIEP